MRRPAWLPEKTRISPGLRSFAKPRDWQQVIVRGETADPGLEYTLEGGGPGCERQRGRLSSPTFYGFNPNVPRLLINEFITQGTTDHPDIVELKVLTGGNMGGVVLYQGTPGSFDDRLVFPSLAGDTGEFIVVHFKPSGDGTEVNETKDKTASGGIDACRPRRTSGSREDGASRGTTGFFPSMSDPEGSCWTASCTATAPRSRMRSISASVSGDCSPARKSWSRDGGWETRGRARQPGRRGQSGRLHGHPFPLPVLHAARTPTAAGDWHIVPTRGCHLRRTRDDRCGVRSSLGSQCP